MEFKQRTYWVTLIPQQHLQLLKTIFQASIPLGLNPDTARLFTENYHNKIFSLNLFLMSLKLGFHWRLRRSSKNTSVGVYTARK